MNTRTIQRKATVVSGVGGPGPDHRYAVALLEGDADALNFPLSGLQGAVTTEATTGFDLLGLKIGRTEVTESLRVSSGLQISDGHAGCQWVSVNPNTRVSTLVKKHGDRLVGFDRTRKSFVVSLLLWNLIDSESSSARVLVRRPKRAN